MGVRVGTGSGCASCQQAARPIGKDQSIGQQAPCRCGAPVRRQKWKEGGREGEKLLEQRKVPSELPLGPGGSVLRRPKPRCYYSSLRTFPAREPALNY